MLDRSSRHRASALKANEWVALLVTLAGVLAALGAVPQSDYRPYWLTGGAGLIVVALIVAALPRRQPEPDFQITMPLPDAEFSGCDLVVVGGVVPDLRPDTLWVFEEGRVDGRRVWLFGGDAVVHGNRWSYEYQPSAWPTKRTRRTLTVVRADQNCDRQFRTVKPDDAGRLVIYDPSPGGCEVLGEISMFLAGRPSVVADD